MESPEPTTRRTGMLCPYCGTFSGNKKECERCKGLFEPLSRQATQNGMGPWFIRDEASPFRPGCSYATMRMLVARKRIVAESVIRGPSTRQFWTFAKNTPGIGHLLGECHACHRAAMPEATRCPQCNASFQVEDDRQYLGLAEVRVIPGQPASAPSPRTQPTIPAAAAFEPSPVVSLTERPEVTEVHAAEAAPHTEFEPIRNPARPLRSSSPMTDAQIDELLRRSSASDRATRSATVVVVLVVAAALAVVLLVVLGVLVYAGGNTTPPTTPTSPAAPAPTTGTAATPAPAASTAPPPSTSGTRK